MKIVLQFLMGVVAQVFIFPLSFIGWVLGLDSYLPLCITVRDCYNESLSLIRKRESGASWEMKFSISSRTTTPMHFYILPKNCPQKIVTKMKVFFVKISSWKECCFLTSSNFHEVRSVMQESPIKVQCTISSARKKQAILAVYALDVVG